MGEGAGVHNHGVILAGCAVDGINERTLVIGLDKVHRAAVGFGKGGELAAQAIVGLLPVDARFPLSQQVQVGAVEYQKFHGYPLFPRSVQVGDEVAQHPKVVGRLGQLSEHPLHARGGDVAG